MFVYCVGIFGVDLRSLGHMTWKCHVNAFERLHFIQKIKLKCNAKNPKQRGVLYVQLRIMFGFGFT